MQLASVLGHATSTVKHSTLAGWKLLVVQPLDAQGGADGTPVLAIDDLGGRRGDQVILTSDGKGVRDMMKSDNTPVRWAVIGIADSD
jgi:ethanolamine utilization protein EutN